MSSVLPLYARCLGTLGGVACRREAGGVEFLLKRPPNENVLPAALRAPAKGGGAGISWILECGDEASSGGGTSVDDGTVEEELSRVEVELS